jgi:hypothetical protein
MAAILSPLSIYGDSLKTKIPLKPTKGTLGIWLSSTIRRMPGDHPMCSLDASLVIPTCVFRFEASRRAQISSPPVKHPVLVLWLNQVTRQFYGELSQTPRAESGREPLPYTSSGPRLRLAFIATMRPTLDPAGHRVVRQVGLTRGTRWLVGSSAGRMVASKARRSRRSEPVQGSGLQPESAREVRGSSPENHRVTWLSHKTKIGGSAGGDEIWARREASMSVDAWRDRRACIGRTRSAATAWPCDEDECYMTYLP